MHRSPRDRTALALLVLGLGGSLGCDDLVNRFSGETTEEKPDTASETKAADAPNDASKSDPKLADAKADPEVADTKAGDTKVEEPKVEPAADDPNKPIHLTEVVVSPQGGMFSSSGALQLTAKAKLNQKIDNGTYIHAKALCKRGDLLMADTTYINADYRKSLQQHEVGEVADVNGILFGQGVTERMAPCQIEFRLAGSGGGISLPIGQACYDGTNVSLEPCDPPVVAAPLSGATKPVEVQSLEVSTASGFGSRGGLSANYVLKLNAPQEDSTRLTLKAACKVGAVKLVDMGTANLMAGPFKYESGEAVARSANLYWNPAFAFADSPNDCDITVAAWQPKSGTFGEYSQLVLKDACFREGKVSDGACDPAEPPPPPPTAAVVGSMKLDNVIIEVEEPYGSKGDKFQLKIQADATIDKPVDQSASVNAKVTCKVGKTARVETAYLYGVELYYLDPGETTRMSSTAFTSNPMEAKPKSCMAEFIGGQRFSPTGDEGIDLGKWCLRGDKMKKGKC